MPDAESVDQSVTVEFLIEPFTEAEPGPHVMAGVDALVDSGLEVDLGPFASATSGDLTTVAQAVGAMVERAIAGGASSVRIHVGTEDASMSVAPLHDALNSMIRSIERDTGKEARDWNRAQKQRAVRQLDENGAFLLRGAVDDIAQIMGVSRITIYNYLNAVERGRE